MEKKTIKINGMSCEHCAAAVTKALSDLAGIKKVKVDLKAKTASFDYESGKTGMDKIKSAINDAGFELVD